MSPQITYRAFQKQDTNALEKIVYDTWQYEQFGKQKTGRRLAKLYLASCLANQTYTQVALADGVPVGIVMGKNIKTYRPSLRSRFQLFWQGLPLLFSAEGRAGMKEYQKLEHIYDEMIEKRRDLYQGEIAFFVVDGAYRGCGIGKELFRRVRNYLRSEGVERCYLYTDTSCSYEFYERHGMRRCVERAHCFVRRHIKLDMQVFLYDYEKLSQVNA